MSYVIMSVCLRNSWSMGDSYGWWLPYSMISSVMSLSPTKCLTSFLIPSEWDTNLPGWSTLRVNYLTRKINLTLHRRGLWFVYFIRLDVFSENSLFAFSSFMKVTHIIIRLLFCFCWYKNDMKCLMKMCQKSRPKMKLGFLVFF